MELFVWNIPLRRRTIFTGSSFIVVGLFNPIDDINREQKLLLTFDPILFWKFSLHRLRLPSAVTQLLPLELSKN